MNVIVIDNNNNWCDISSLIKKEDIIDPIENAPILKSYVELKKGLGVNVYDYCGNVIITQENTTLYYHNVESIEIDPFVTVEPVGSGYHSTIEVPKRNRNYWGSHYNDTQEYERVLDTYGGHYNYYSRRVDDPGIPWNYLKLRISDGQDSVEKVMKFKRPNAGTAFVNKHSRSVRLEYDFFGLRLEWKEDIPGRTEGWYKIYNLLKNYEIRASVGNEMGPMVLWRCYFNHIGGLVEADDKGVVGTEKKKGIRENLAKLEINEPIIWQFYQWLHNSSGSGGISNNNLLTAFLKKSGLNYKKLRDSLYNVMTDIDHMSEPSTYYSSYSGPPCNRGLCICLPGARDRKEEKLAKTQWQYQKGLKKQAEALGIDKTRFPKLSKAVENNNIPISIFHEPGDKDSLVNVEFLLWEKALKRKDWADVLFDIAQTASGRKSYEKNITPYISFLFRLEKYLDRHTPRGKKWKAFPKLVNSQWELEMDENAGGTTKKRSALTPVADNETRTVVVPYASLAIHGRQTTYCYSLNYYVFEENMIDPESKTPVINELEEKLNGRDDYGLMFYTLTGSPSNRGYPAFLIIFERLSDKTRVHFHRVHPSRRKNGKMVPACKLIEECYRYMAGNIRAEEIEAQQGDLIFIKKEQEMDFSEGKFVESFESHAFIPSNGSPVLLLENTAKSAKNRLGHIYSDSSFIVDHPEHEPLNNMSAGVYEVRRVKSYENNPLAVWSLTID